MVQRMNWVVLAAALLPAVAGAANAASAAVPPLYKDPTLPVETRVRDLVSRLTVEEKVLLLGGTGFTTQAIPRLDVPAFVMSDGPVGLRNAGPTTAYPAGIGLAASFNIANAHAIGTALGRDARSRGVHFLLGPAMDLYRSPLSGRNFEYLGEDPVLAGTLAAAYVESLQAEKVAATMKHFAGNEQEFDRHNLDTTVDERTLRELYLRPFQICVEQGHPWAAMTSYNPLNGVHASQNKWLITDVLKGEWQFPGIVMSDWDSCYDTVGMAEAGLDLEMPKAVFYAPEKVMPLLADKKIEQGVIDDKVRRLFTVAFSMGWFDHPQVDPAIQADDPQNYTTALSGALDSLTLLKNENHFFPLDRSAIKSIVLIGPTADPAVVSGGGSASLMAFHPISILEGVRALAGEKVKVRRIAWTPPGLTRQMMRQAPASGTWKAEFFANEGLEGAPALERTDRFVDFKWATRAPGAKVPHEHFSARWTGKIRVDKSGPVEFTCAGDDGFRLMLDGRAIIDDWTEHALTEKNATATLQAGRDYAVVVEYFNATANAEIHFGWGAPRELLTTEDAALVKEADVVLACLGFNDKTGAKAAYEGEGSDRAYGLPAEQVEIVSKSLELNPRTAVILCAGGGVDTAGWLERTPAFLDAYYPGSAGGTAVGATIFGDNNPSGKLPFTWERTLADYPATANYPSKETGRVNTYKEGLFTGYRREHLQDRPPLFAFGFGLSYTKFEVGKAGAPEVTAEKVTFTVPVRNTGARPGAEVIELYVSPPESGVRRPAQELKAYAKVSVGPGETKTVRLSFPTSALGYWDETAGGWRVAPGVYTAHVGTSSTELGQAIEFKPMP